MSATGWDERLRKPMAQVVLGVVSVTGLIALWWWTTDSAALVSPLILPPPQDVADGFENLLRNDYQGNTLLAHAWQSLRIVLIAWLLAGITGALIGTLSGWSRMFRAVVYPIFQFIRPIPPIAWIPIAILWFGVGTGGRVFVVWLAAVVPWTVNSREAVASVDPLLIRAARVLGARGTAILGRVVLPVALPTLLTGARIALGNAWMTVIAAELLGATAGLGFVTLNARATLEPATMLVAMFTIGVLGVALNAAVLALQRAATPWDRERSK